MRSMIIAVLAAIASIGTWVAKNVLKYGRFTIEWIHERGPAIASGFGETLEALAAAPGRLLQHLLPGRGPAISPPQQSADPQQERAAAAQQAQQEVSLIDQALCVRSAARALLREEKPTQTLPAQVSAWLHSLDGSALTYLAALQPQQVQGLLKGQSTAQVPGFNAKWNYCPKDTKAPAPKASASSPEHMRGLLHAALLGRARERVGEHPSNTEKANNDVRLFHRAAGTCR